MINLILLCIIAALWLSDLRRPFNLTFIILLYYVGYLCLQPASEYSADWAGYYLLQSALDSLVVIACCYLSTFYQVRHWVPLGYAAIVGTSQLTQQLVLTNPGVFMSVFEIRQWLSIPLDLLFALLGSGFGVRFMGFASRVFGAYNKHNDPINSDGKNL